MTTYTLAQLADRVSAQLEGTQASLDSEQVKISGVADVASALPGQLSFFSNQRYLVAAKNTKASALIVPRSTTEHFPCPVLRSENPSLAFSQITALFAPEPVHFPPGIHPTAVIAPDAEIGEGVSIAPYAVIEPGVKIGNRSVIGAGGYVGHYSQIGADCLLYPKVSIRERCLIGDRVILHCGVVIGSDGFGYEFSQGQHIKVPQTGFVQLDADVEVGANTTIDRGRFGRTWIQRGTKIDNLVMVAHNVVVGEHSILVGQCGIAGSTILGKYVTIAGQTAIGGHLHLGDKCTITGKSGVNKDVPEGAVLSGRRAMPLRESLKIEALYRRLPEIFDRVDKLEKPHSPAV